MTKLRTRSTPAPTLKSNPAPHATLHPPIQSVGLGLWLFTGIAVMLGALYFHQSFSYAFWLGLHWGFWVAVVYWLWPIIFFVLGSLYYRRLPSAYFLKQFSPSQKIISCLILAFCITIMLDLAIPYALHAWHFEHPAFHYHTYRGLLNDKRLHEYFDIGQFFITWLVITIGLAFFLDRWISSRPKELLAKEKACRKAL